MEWIALAISVIEAVAAIVAIFIARKGIIIPLQESRKQAMEEELRQKRKDTIEAVLNLQREALDPLMEYDADRVNASVQKKKKAKSYEDKLEYAELKKILIKCNQFILIMNEEVYDKQLALELTKSALADAYSKLLPVVKDLRIRNKNGYHEFEEFYREYNKYRQNTYVKNNI